MKTTFLITLTVLALTSCKPSHPNKSVEEGKVEGNLYTSEEIGWTMEIPQGWKVIDKEKSEEFQEQGKKALENNTEATVDLNGLNMLISFQKDQFNIFQSTSEPFNQEYEGQWEENNAATKAIIYATYVNMGIQADSTATKTISIDGLDFQSYTFAIRAPEGNVIMTQTMFTRYINGFGFGANINYNNEKDRDEMFKAFLNSKFKK
ncbi:MAG: hypothetical protein WBP43_09360 [Chitinophagales bacterium]